MSEARRLPTTRQQVAHVLGARLRSSSLCKALRALPAKTHLVAAHALHNLAASDDLRTLEEVVRSVYPNIETIVDKPLGRRNYTALCIAAYHGSPQCTKYLITKGADVEYTNEHGEDLLGTLAAGEADARSANPPEDHIFVHERYRSTRRWIEERRNALRRGGSADYGEACAAPPRIRAALAILRWWRARRCTRAARAPAEPRQ